MKQIYIEQNGMDYQNGKIYQILNGETNDVYVGSTCSSSSKRWHEHRISINKPGRLYEMMKEIGRDCFYIELIEECPCTSKDMLRAREGHYIRERSTLNTNIAGRNRKEYLVENAETVKQTNNEYMACYRNKPDIQKKNEERRTIKLTCECGVTIAYGSIAVHRTTDKHKQLMEQLN